MFGNGAHNACQKVMSKGECLEMAHNNACKGDVKGECWEWRNNNACQKVVVWKWRNNNACQKVMSKCLEMAQQQCPMPCIKALNMFRTTFARVHTSSGIGIGQIQGHGLRGCRSVLGMAVGSRRKASCSVRDEKVCFLELQKC